MNTTRRPHRHHIFSTSYFPNILSTSGCVEVVDFTAAIRLDNESLVMRLEEARKGYEVTMGMLEEIVSERNAALTSTTTTTTSSATSSDLTATAAKSTTTTTTTTHPDKHQLRVNEQYLRMVHISDELSDLKSALKLLRWIECIEWELDAPTFTQVPEWGSLARGDVEMSIRDAIERDARGFFSGSATTCNTCDNVNINDECDDKNEALASSPSSSVELIEVVSAARQGKSLMLNQLGHYYKSRGWTVVPVTFNGARTHIIPKFVSKRKAYDVGDNKGILPRIWNRMTTKLTTIGSADNDDDLGKHCVMELWSRVLVACTKSEDIDTCRNFIWRNKMFDGGSLAQLLQNVFSHHHQQPVLLLVDELSVLTDAFPNMSSSFTKYLNTFLSSSSSSLSLNYQRHRIVYTTFDATLRNLNIASCGRRTHSFELPLLINHKTTADMAEMLLPQKIAFRILCEKEGLPFLFYYNIFKSSPGTMGALLDPMATAIPMFLYLRSHQNDHLWGECLRPYIIESTVLSLPAVSTTTTLGPTTTTCTTAATISRNIANQLLKHKIGVDGGQRVVPAFLAVYILSRGPHYFKDDTIWDYMISTFSILREGCRRTENTTQNFEIVKRDVVEKITQNALLLQVECERQLKSKSSWQSLTSYFTATTSIVAADEVPDSRSSSSSSVVVGHRHHHHLSHAVTIPPSLIYFMPDTDDEHESEPWKEDTSTTSMNPIVSKCDVASAFARTANISLKEKLGGFLGGAR